MGYEDDVNLYAYVRNDPLNGTDNSGMQWSPLSPSPITLSRACGGDLGCAADMAQEATIGPEGTAAVALGLGAGAVVGRAGAITIEKVATTIEPAIPAGEGALIGGVADLANQAASGNPTDPGQTLRAMAVGAAIGPTVAATRGAANQMVVAGTLAAGSTPFVSPDSTSSDATNAAVLSGLSSQAGQLAGAAIEVAGAVLSGIGDKATDDRQKTR